jgi:tRNA modification GTPase
LGDLKTYRVRYGKDCGSRITGKMVDEALAIVMRAPHSYTAEDVVETPVSRRSGFGPGGAYPSA